MDNTRTNNSVNEPPGELPGDKAIYEILCRISESWRQKDGLPMVSESRATVSDKRSAPVPLTDDESAETIIIRPQRSAEHQKRAPKAALEDPDKTVILDGAPAQNREKNPLPSDIDKETAFEDGDTTAPPSLDNDDQTLIIPQTGSDHSMVPDETLIVHHGPAKATHMAATPQDLEADDIVTETIVLGPGSYDRP